MFPNRPVVGMTGVVVASSGFFKKPRELDWKFGLENMLGFSFSPSFAGILAAPKIFFAGAGDTGEEWWVNIAGVDFGAPNNDPVPSNVFATAGF